MNELDLPDLKAYLRVIHNADDALLTQLLASAEEQARRFLGVRSLAVQASLWSTSTTDAVIPADVVTAVFLLVRAEYEATDPQHAQDWRDVAYERLYSYRKGLGV